MVCTWDKAVELLSERKMDEFKTCVEEGFELNKLSYTGNTIMYYFFTDYSIVKMLLEMGADPNLVPTHESIILNNQCRSRYPDKYKFVKLLLDYGANPNLKDAKGKTAIEHAIIEKDINIIKLILQYPDLIERDQLELLTKYQLRALVG